MKTKKLIRMFGLVMVAAIFMFGALAEPTPKLIGGDSMAQAAMMSAGQKIQSELDASDKFTQNQWYAFKSEDESVFYQFEVENLGSTGHAQGFGWDVCDEDGAVLYSCSVESGRTRNYALKVPVGQVVYAHIYGYYESINGLYRVQLSQVADAEGDVGITLENGGIHSVDVKEDVDIFVYPSGSVKSYMHLEAVNIGCDGDWKIEVYDIDGVKINDMRVYGKSNRGNMVVPMEKDNLYTFKVYALDCFGNYQLNYTVLEDMEGDAPETALKVEAGKLNELRFDVGDDVDYLVLESTSAERNVAITLNTQCDGVEAFCDVYDVYGRKLVDGQRCLNGEICIQLTLAANEPMYIALKGYQTGRYTVEICTDDTHQADGQWAIIAPAGCASEGSRVQHCKICGMEMLQEVIPAGVHTLGQWEIELEVTCATDGIQHNTCTVCGMVVSRERIPCVGHVLAEQSTLLQEANCEHDGLEGWQCLVCGQYCNQTVIPGSDHVPGEKLTVGGVPSAICNECGTIYPIEAE